MQTRKTLPDLTLPPALARSPARLRDCFERRRWSHTIRARPLNWPATGCSVRSPSARSWGLPMATKYKRPPITEAVVEIKIDPPIESALLDRVQARLLESYPLPPQRIMLTTVQVGDEAPKIQHEPQGYKLTAPDGAGLVTVAANLISTSRLAPYQGWEPFIATARANWEVWKRLVGWRRITRIGVRYINRIDVPNPEDRSLELGDYFKFSIQLPPLELPPMTSFAANCMLPLGKEQFTLILNAGSVPSPLVKTASFILDVDISREADLPQNDDGLWTLIGHIREHKNFVFEGCITDLTRELFNL